jgi:hypothetical protein
MENADPAVLLTECPQRDDSQVPAAMVADEHQFGHWAECLGMADLATGKIAAAHVSIITAYNPRASSLKPLYTPGFAPKVPLAPKRGLLHQKSDLLYI